MLFSRKTYLPLLALSVTANTCDDPGTDANADRVNLVEGETVMYICKQGYQTVLYEEQITLNCIDGLWGPVNPPSMSQICISSGATTDSNAVEATTAALACADPGLVENSDRWFDHFEEGGVVYFSCKADYCAKDLRTRTVEMTCQNGKWSTKPPTCVPCSACAPPTGAELEKKKINMHINTDFTASLTCDEYHVIKAGTSITDGTVECIEGGIWSPEIPTCSIKPQVVCGSNEISVMINKNMLDSLGFTGGVNSLAMTGMNANTEIIMKDCQPTIDDAGENYSFHIQSPYAGKCMTHFEHHMVDGMGNEANNYVFKNKIVWRQNSGAVVRSATLLDWTCEYEGLFTTGLDGPIKLALSTRTYIDKRRGYKQQEFTVSMGIYANKNYTNLLESSQVVHRGKRYFVALWLHEEEKGTPFLQNCYGSPNEVSQEELIKLGRQPEPDSQIRSLIVEGCPAERTLTRLELPGSTADRRFSFMYPFVSANGYTANYMYIHCEMKLRPTGYKPNCVRPASVPAGAGIGGLTDDTGTKLGDGQFFQRSYKAGIGNAIDFLQNKNIVKNNLNIKEYWGSNFKRFDNAMNIPPTIDEFIAQQGSGIMQKSSNGGTGTNSNYAVFSGRRRKRRATDDVNYAVSLGPMVMISDDDIKPEDITEVTIQTKMPMIANADGSIDIDLNQDPTLDSYEFKFNTTYVSREDDVEKFKELLPQDRYVKDFDKFDGEIMWESEKQTSEEGESVADLLEDSIVAEDIEEEVLEEEEKEAENFAVRAIVIISCFVVGGLVLFAIAMYATMNSDCCIPSSESKGKKQVKKVKSAVPNVVVAGPNMTHAADEKQLNNSCGSSLTSAEN